MKFADVDARDIKGLARDLELFASRAVPYAARTAINEMAFQARTYWQGEIRDEFILRNQFTENSLRVARATSLQVATMAATTYTIASYLGKQEKGSTKRPGGRHGVAIPTSFAAGQKGSQPRTRLVRRPNKMARISLADQRLSGFSNKRQAVAVAIRMAAAEGAKFVFLDLDYKGIFRLTGPKRRPRLEMVWDLTKSSVEIPPTPTLEPALDALWPHLDDINRKALLEQLRRNRILGYR